MEDRFTILRSVGDAGCINDQELRDMLEAKNEFRVYDGFEPSGRMHIAQGLKKAVNVNKCTQTGGTFSFWIADWFALMNGKMGGDMDKIELYGKYFLELWKACGMDMKHVDFVWASKTIQARSKEYWGIVTDVCRLTTLCRVIRCCPILGKTESDNLTASQIMYPLMQCSDIMFLRTDVTQLGNDQLAVNVLCRDYCTKLKKKRRPPIIISHGMMKGMLAGQAKMSKSNPDSAIFMDDSADEVSRKIMAAYCPMDSPKENPLLDYVEHLFFQAGETFLDTSSFDELAQALKSGSLTENGFRREVIDQINAKLGVVQDNLKASPKAMEIMNQIEEFDQQPKGPSNSPSSHFTFTECEDALIIFLPLPGNVSSSTLVSPYVTTFSRSLKKRVNHPPEDPQDEDSNLLKLGFNKGYLPGLESFLEILREIKKSTHRNIILYARDLTAFVLNSLAGDAKSISTYFQIYQQALSAYQTTFVLQSEVAYSKKSSYFFTLIDIGRHYTIDDLTQKMCTSNDSEFQKLHSSGEIMGCLLNLVDTQMFEKARTLVMEKELAKLCGTVAPHKFIFLTQRNMSQISVGDPLAIISSKVKKIFAPVKEDNPLLDLARVVFSMNGKLRVHVGTDELRDFECFSDLFEHYAREDLHPGDLKAALRDDLHEIFKNFETTNKRLISGFKDRTKKI